MKLKSLNLFIVQCMKNDSYDNMYKNYVGDSLHYLLKAKYPKSKNKPFSTIMREVKSEKKQDNRTAQQIIDDTLKLFNKEVED